MRKTQWVIPLKNLILISYENTLNIIIFNLCNYYNINLNKIC